jgi:hypothetical protein
MFITYDTIDEALDNAMTVAFNCSKQDKAAVMCAFVSLINTICKVEADKCQVG